MSKLEEIAALVQVNGGVLDRIEGREVTVGLLERLLLTRYPKADAESWDRMGLLVGDPEARVTGVAIALDATVDAVRAAKAAGANVLLTHHPVFIEAPVSFHPLGTRGMGPGSVVFEAISSGVALMNFHTALDVSVDGAHMLPRLLGLQLEGIVDVVCDDGRGYGQLCSLRESDTPMDLRSLAARCLAIFGRPARVWGSMDVNLEKIVTCTGSAGDLPKRCIAAGYDCLVCGEVRYHAALEASQAGLCIIELGHDVSELPFCAVLAAVVASLGYPEKSISILDQGANWTVPEAIRK